MKHHLKTALKHIRRSPYQSFLALVAMTMTFFVMSIFMLTILYIQGALSDFETRPQVTAFFSDLKTEEEIRLLDEKLKNTGKVESTKFISKEEALTIYQDQNKDDPLLLEFVTADILPASLEIRAIDPNYLEDLALILIEEPGVEDAMYLRDEVEALMVWTRAIRTEGLILISSLLIVSLLVLLMVIGMKVALRKEEIEVLKLLGATNWYIRWPFIIEGGFYGSVAGLLAWGLSYIRILYATPFFQGSFWGTQLLQNASPHAYMLPLLGILVLGGLLLGMIGSFLALLRYL